MPDDRLNRVVAMFLVIPGPVTKDPGRLFRTSPSADRMFRVDELEPIEDLLRDERLNGDALLVVRGWPLTVDGLLRNADGTRHRFSRAGEPASRSRPSRRR